MYGKIHALDGLDLTAKEGSILAVLGPNGAGKTTAVRILTTLSRPDSGRAEVAGRRDRPLRSALASFWPARNASRLTVRDVLAYE